MQVRQKHEAEAVVIGLQGGDGETGTETKGTHVVVIVLASDSNEGASLWSALR